MKTLSPSIHFVHLITIGISLFGQKLLEIPTKLKTDSQISQYKFSTFAGSDNV